MLLNLLYCSYVQSDIADYDRYMLAKSYLDLQEYDRAAHFTKSCKSHKAYFIHIYSRYLAGEKRRVDDSVDSFGKSFVNFYCIFIKYIIITISVVVRQGRPQGLKMWTHNRWGAERV